MSPGSVPAPVRTVSPDASARDAARALDRWHVGFLVVVENDRPVGVLTDRDLALRVLAERRNPSACRVAEIMTTPAITLPAGGVAMIERSRNPDMAMFRVRGMGVAVRVRMSTSARRAFSRSL